MVCQIAHLHEEGGSTRNDGTGAFAPADFCFFKLYEKVEPTAERDGPAPVTTIRRRIAIFPLGRRTSLTF